MRQALKSERANDFMAVPRPVLALARDLPPLHEIDWIEAADNYARVRTGTRSYLLRESLGTLEERIGANGFVRAHRRALVRIDAVHRLTRNDDGVCIAILSSGARIPVSRRRRATFVSALRAARS